MVRYVLLCTEPFQAVASIDSMNKYENYIFFIDERKIIEQQGRQRAEISFNIKTYINLDAFVTISCFVAMNESQDCGECVREMYPWRPERGVLVNAAQTTKDTREAGERVTKRTKGGIQIYSMCVCVCVCVCVSTCEGSVTRSVTTSSLVYLMKR